MSGKLKRKKYTPTGQHRENLSIAAKKHWRNKELRRLKGIERIKEN